MTGKVIKTSLASDGTVRVVAEVYWDDGAAEIGFSVDSKSARKFPVGQELSFTPKPVKGL